MSFGGLTSELGAAKNMSQNMPKMPKAPKPPKAPKMPTMPGMPGSSSGDSAPAPDSSLEPSGSVGIARWLNIWSIMLVIAMMTMTITQQVGYGMPPSELGVLQRSALVGACLAPILNLLGGMRPQHYALALFAGVVGLAASGKEIANHAGAELSVDPNEIVFGRPFFEWTFVVFMIAVIGVGVMLLWVKSWMALDYGIVHHWGPSRTWAFAMIIWLGFYVVFTIFQIPVQCDGWVCPADPTSSGSMGWVFTIGVSDAAGDGGSISIPGFITIMLGIGLVSLIAGAILNAKMTSQKDGTSSVGPAS